MILLSFIACPFDIDELEVLEVNNLFKITLFCALCLVLEQGRAQSLVPYPNHYLQNTSSIFTSDRPIQGSEFQLEYQNIIGAYSAIRRIYAQGRLDVHKTGFLGASVYSEQQTRLLTRNRVVIGYGNSIKLRTDIDFSFGIQLGAINMLAIATDNIPGGSAFGINTSYSLSLSTPKWQTGFAIHQLPEQELRPGTYSFGFTESYYAHITRSLSISSTVDLRLSVMAKYFNANPDLLGDAEVLIREKYGVLLGYVNGPTVGLFSLLERKKSNLRIYGSFKPDSRQDQIAQPQMQIGIVIRGLAPSS